MMSIAIHPHKKTVMTIVVSVLLVMVSLLAFVIWHSRDASAVSGSSFNPGRIIDDSVFYNGRSMTASQIQTFLSAKVPFCDTNGSQPATDWGRSDITRETLASYIRSGTHGYKKNSNFHAPPYTCLRDYRQNTPQMEAASGLCEALPARSNRTAAQIISDVSIACGINPQVLIVLLEKEQSLVTDIWPLTRQYRSATGFDCPDTAPCDPKYAGLFYQVYYAARQFKVYRANPNTYNYTAGRANKVYWQTSLGEFINSTGNANDPSRKSSNPGAPCGYSNVHIENQATAALYIYTPYRPNQKALANLGGTGDDCSAYGNRNFWRLFTQWFGSTTGVGIYTIQYDVSTDTSGETGKIGYGLTKKPTSTVTLELGVSSRSNAAIASSATIVITPDNWNKPENNTVIVKGLDNKNLIGTTTYQVVPTNITSRDARYNHFPLDLVGDATLVQQRVGSARTVYRLKSPAPTRHLFTANSATRDSFIAQGWTQENSGIQYCNAGEKTIFSLRKDDDQRLFTQNYGHQLELTADGFESDGPMFTLSSFGTKPVYWRYDTINKRSLYTLSPTEGLSAGFADKGIVGYSCSEDQLPVYRLYKPGGSHLYTISAAEREKAQFQLHYRYERLAFYACSEGAPVYRLLKASTGVRFYTTSDAERSKAIGLGYAYEGIAFYTCADGSTTIYRLYEQRTGRRLYTTSTSERDSAVQSGFTYEGIAFTT